LALCVDACSWHINGNDNNNNNNNNSPCKESSLAHLLGISGQLNMELIMKMFGCFDLEGLLRPRGRSWQMVKEMLPNANSINSLHLALKHPKACDDIGQLHSLKTSKTPAIASKAGLGATQLEKLRAKMSKDESRRSHSRAGF
jgi:hypothetical protein